MIDHIFWRELAHCHKSVSVIIIVLILFNVCVFQITVFTTIFSFFTVGSCTIFFKAFLSVYLLLQIK